MGVTEPATGAAIIGSVGAGKGVIGKEAINGAREGATGAGKGVIGLGEAIGVRTVEYAVHKAKLARETRNLKAEFMVLKERLVENLKLVPCAEQRAKLIEESFPPCFLSVFNNGYASMTPDKIFCLQYLGSKLKWYQPSDVVKFAEELGCEPEFMGYMKKLYLYLRGRSLVQSNRVIIDEEWNPKIYEQGFKNAPDLVRLLETIEYDVLSSIVNLSSRL